MDTRLNDVSTGISTVALRLVAIVVLVVLRVRQVITEDVHQTQYQDQ